MTDGLIVFGIALFIVCAFCTVLCAWADDTVAYHVDAALGPETDDERDWFADNYEATSKEKP